MLILVIGSMDVTTADAAIPSPKPNLSRNPTPNPNHNYNPKAPNPNPNPESCHIRRSQRLPYTQLEGGIM